MQSQLTFNEDYINTIVYYHERLLTLLRHGFAAESLHLQASVELAAPYLPPATVVKLRFVANLCHSVLSGHSPPDRFCSEDSFIATCEELEAEIRATTRRNGGWFRPVLDVPRLFRALSRPAGMRQRLRWPTWEEWVALPLVALGIWGLTQSFSTGPDFVLGHLLYAGIFLLIGLTCYSVIDKEDTHYQWISLAMGIVLFIWASNLDIHWGTLYYTVFVFMWVAIVLSRRSGWLGHTALWALLFVGGIVYVISGLAVMFMILSPILYGEPVPSGPKLHILFVAMFLTLSGILAMRQSTGTGSADADNMPRLKHPPKKPKHLRQKQKALKRQKRQLPTAEEGEHWL